MIDALIQGKVFKAATQKTTVNGDPYCTVMIDTATKDRSGAMMSQAIGVTAFNKQAVQALLALEVGDAVAVAGELTLSIYTAKDGTVKPSASLTCHHVTSAYHISRKRDTSKQVSSLADTQQQATDSTDALETF